MWIRLGVKTIVIAIQGLDLLDLLSVADLESLSEAAAKQCGTGRTVDRDSLLRSALVIRKAVINVDLGLSGPARGAKWHSQWPEAKLERYLKPEAISEVPRPGLIAI